jgi:hypothetical protein
MPRRFLDAAWKTTMADGAPNSSAVPWFVDENDLPAELLEAFQKAPAAGQAKSSQAGDGERGDP